jgi:HKD family nuclease
MNLVFANRTSRRDSVLAELQRLTQTPQNVYIAVAFFTQAEVVLDLLARGCQVQMVVRLGFPTSPAALDAVRSHPNMQLRVYTGRSFHPKLYIFGDDTALVGSANLTNAAITTNQEVMVSIGAEDDRFDELTVVFSEYWDGAEVPSDGQLDLYKKLYREYERHEDAADALARKAADVMGNTAPANIERGDPKKGARSLFLSNFRKAYQEGVAAFNIVRNVYAASGYRKVDEADIPLRIEIDSFVSFVRERVATGESWKSSPIRTAAEQKPIIEELIEQWRPLHWRHFEDDIVPDNYPRLQRVFASPQTLMAANDDELFDALATLHSFYDRFRFFPGGLATWKQTFRTFNDAKRTRESLAYLVFGSDDIVERMANLLFDPRHRLNEFGRANIQELVGWCNREELPILNGRTTKVLRFFGSKVRQVT